MGYHKFIAPNQKEESISIQRVDFYVHGALLAKTCAKKNGALADSIQLLQFKVNNSLSFYLGIFCFVLLIDKTYISNRLI